MSETFIKVSGKITADAFGCDAAYFRKTIRGKALRIVQSTLTHYIRVKDQNQEEWGLFPGQYIVTPGPEGVGADQSPEDTPEKLSQGTTRSLGLSG